MLDKPKIVTLNVHELNRERLIFPDNLFFMAQCNKTERSNMFKVDKHCC